MNAKKKNGKEREREKDGRKGSSHPKSGPFSIAQFLNRLLGIERHDIV